MNNQKIYTLIFILLAGIGILYFYNKYKVAPKIDIINLEVIDENNAPFDIKTLKGKKVIVSMYASWCPDCLKELKEINAIKNTKLSDVTVLAITDESIEKLISFKNKKQYPYTFLKLKKSFNDIKVFSIPTVYILNTKGKIVYEHVGYINWNDESTLNHLKTLME